MRQNYQGGNYGYGHAKKALLELIKTKYATERERFNYYLENQEELEKALELGAQKARAVAIETLERVRGRLGYQSIVKRAY